MASIEELLEKEIGALSDRTPQSLALARRAIEVMPLAVPTNVCALDPYPLAIDRGEGAYLYDIDDNKYVDYHNGFGAQILGHANPIIKDAVDIGLTTGTHFGATSEVVCQAAEMICERWDLNWLRFSHSGTEATMDAIRLARAATGRVKVAKIEGGYHGSHEAALVSCNLSLDGSEGPDDNPTSRFFGEGIPPRVLDEVIAIPFNDLAAAERACRQNLAAIIIEPILFNVGAIFPLPQYLQSLREICRETGTLLIFDETKTAATIAYGGASELFGVTPDIKTLGKALGGGLPLAVVGGCEPDLYALIEDGTVPHLGTFCGNPLSARSAIAAMSILDQSAYEKLDNHGRELKEMLDEIIKAYNLPAYVVQAGAKGCLVWVAGDPLRDYRDYRRRFNFDLGYLSWVYLMNRGVFLAPGQDEQWTHSLCHGKKEANAFAEAIASLAEEISS